jgi:hypothetical protein
MNTGKLMPTTDAASNATLPRTGIHKALFKTVLGACRRRKIPLTWLAAMSQAAFTAKYKP